jgi:Flp pilus assembly protein TadG
MEARRPQPKLRRDAGQTLLEVALLTPMLLLLLLGVIELGRYAYFGILVGNAARAGAAYGSQNGALTTDGAGICKAAGNDFYQSATFTCTSNSATSYTASATGAATLNLTLSTSCGCESAGDMPPAPPNTPGSCSVTLAVACTSEWVITMSVTASSQISPLINYPGLPLSLTVTRTATMPTPDE